MLDRARADSIADWLAVALDVDRTNFFVADHTHEELSPGAFSIACEGINGDLTWTSLASAAQFWPVSPYGPGIHVEALTSWAIALYPSPDTTGITAPIAATPGDPWTTPHDRFTMEPITWTGTAWATADGRTLDLWSVYA